MAQIFVGGFLTHRSCVLVRIANLASSFSLSLFLRMAYSHCRIYADDPRDGTLMEVPAHEFCCSGVHGCLKPLRAIPASDLLNEQCYECRGEQCLCECEGCDMKSFNCFSAIRRIGGTHRIDKTGRTQSFHFGCF